MQKKIPDPFLVSLFPPQLDLDPVTLCAGFDGGVWRCQQLAEHLVEWIMEFSLRKSERAVLSPGNVVALVRLAAGRVFEKDSRERGEAGELLLHAACRQEFSTEQLVARMYYKSSLDEQVHGFDCVHFRQDANGNIELWLGEAKLYASVDGAISKARSSIKEHLDRGFIKAQKTLIVSKIADEDTDLYLRVQRLFHPNTPIDAFLDALVIPVLIASNSPAVQIAERRCASYLTTVAVEMNGVNGRLKSGSEFANLRIQPIYVPLHSKEEFRKAFGEALKGMKSK